MWAIRATLSISGLFLGLWLAVCPGPVSALAREAPPGRDGAVRVAAPLERPADAIHDPAAMLPAETRRQLAEELAAIRDAGGLDVILVLLERTGGEDPAEVALDLANRWGDASGRAVILHVDGWSRSPWIAVSGSIVGELPPRLLESIRIRAEQRARDEVGLENRLREALGALTDETRFVRASARGGKIVEVERKVPYSSRELILVLARNLPVLIAASVVVLGGLFLLWRLLRPLRRWLLGSRPIEFPALACKRRLGAPYGASVSSQRSDLPDDPTISESPSS